jgi:hypothetical protein
MIRDGLILNIIGFVWTPEFIADWQTRPGAMNPCKHNNNRGRQS